MIRQASVAIAGAQLKPNDGTPEEYADAALRSVAYELRDAQPTQARRGSYLYWQHECGHVEAMAAGWTPGDGGCDACESGSDNPADWQPLYLLRPTARPYVAKDGADRG